MLFQTNATNSSPSSPSPPLSCAEQPRGKHTRHSRPGDTNRLLENILYINRCNSHGTSYANIPFSAAFMNYPYKKKGGGQWVTYAVFTFTELFT
jgi:hypothetical protein